MIYTCLLTTAGYRALQEKLWEKPPGSLISTLTLVGELAEEAKTHCQNFLSQRDINNIVFQENIERSYSSLALSLRANRSFSIQQSLTCELDSLDYEFVRAKIKILPMKKLTLLGPILYQVDLWKELISEEAIEEIVFNTDDALTINELVPCAVKAGIVVSQTLHRQLPTSRSKIILDLPTPEKRYPCIQSFQKAPNITIKVYQNTAENCLYLYCYKAGALVMMRAISISTTYHIKDDRVEIVGQADLLFEPPVVTVLGLTPAARPHGL